MAGPAAEGLRQRAAAPGAGEEAAAATATETKAAAAAAGSGKAAPARSINVPGHVVAKLLFFTLALFTLPFVAFYASLPWWSGGCSCLPGLAGFSFKALISHVCELRHRAKE